MVFAQAPCSPLRNKWRHGTCLGLLPASKNGISDIARQYLAAFGDPESGRKVIIRTRQQRDGWEAKNKDLGALVPVKPVVDQSRAGVPPSQSPLPKSRRILVPVSSARRLPSQPRPLLRPCRPSTRKPCTRDPRRTSTGPTPLHHRSSKGRRNPLGELAPRRRLRPRAHTLSRAPIAQRRKTLS